MNKLFALLCAGTFACSALTAGDRTAWKGTPADRKSPDTFFEPDGVNLSTSFDNNAETVTALVAAVTALENAEAAELLMSELSAELQDTPTNINLAAERLYDAIQKKEDERNGLHPDVVKAKAILENLHLAQQAEHRAKRRESVYKTNYSHTNNRYSKTNAQRRNTNGSSKK